MLKKPFEILLLVFIVFSILIRFVWLNRFPVGMYHDEVEYMLSAKSYALKGSDLSGYSFPLSLFETETDGRISAVPPILLSPLYLILPLNQLTARLPFIFLSLLTALALFFLTDTLFKNRTLNFITLLVFLLNPWSFYLSRYSGDSPFALFFYLLGIFLFVKYKGAKLGWSFLAFVLGFFSYHGAKIIFLPLIFLLLCFKSLGQPEGLSISSSVKVFFASVAFFGIFLTVSFLIPGSILNSRSDNFFFSNSSEISQIVDEQRRVSVESPFKSIFTNKYSVIGRIFSEKYLKAFSPDVLFLYGDERATYRFSEHGLFYLLDFVLLIFGGLGIYKFSQRIFFLLISLIAIAPLPTALSGVETSVIHRSFLVLPIFLIFIGYGFWYLHVLLKPFLGKVMPALVLGVIFLFSACNFYYFYFFRYPVINQEAYFLSERLITKALNLTDSPEVVVAKGGLLGRAEFLEYVFYSDQNLQNQVLIKNFPANKTGQFQIRNILFLDSCPNRFDQSTVYFIHRDLSTCNPPLGQTGSIPDQKDSGSVYRIFNSGICQSNNNLYKRFSNFTDFQIENMPQEQFCGSWIIK